MPYTAPSWLVLTAVATLASPAAAAAAAAAALEPLPAPPRGYSTWQWYPGTHWGKGQGQYNAVDEATCRLQAEAMVEKGLVKAGYTVFVVDEPCFAGRDSNGELQPNSTTWPNGFKAFGEFLSERGMQLGIYTDAGPYTCQGCPASAGHEAQDIATFISWGASYVKVDRCFGVDSDAMRESLPSTFSKYRDAADRISPAKRVQISAILAGTDNCWEWCNGTCDHCRTTGDIRNSFGAMQGHVDQQESIPYIESFAGPGYFNDLDMLIIGNMSADFCENGILLRLVQQLPYRLPLRPHTILTLFHFADLSDNGPSSLSPAEQQSHIALWAILKSPLLLSCDIRSLSKDTLGMLLSKGMLDIFDDPLAQQAKRIRAGAGTNVPQQLTFDACPPDGTPPLPRQQWVFGKDGQIISKAYPGRAVTLNDCGETSSRLQLCATDPKMPQPPGPGCTNTTCPSANIFNVKIETERHRLSHLVAFNAHTIKNELDGQCMEGMLGPQRSFVQTSPCASNNIKQRWTMHDDGTLRASNNLTDQCLTAEIGLPTPGSGSSSSIDIFASALADGGAAVVFFNRASTTANTTLALSELKQLPGWKISEGTAIAHDVWSGKKLELRQSSDDAIAVLPSGNLEPHGSSFIRLTETTAA